MLRLGERATRVPAPRQAGDRWNPSRVQFKVVVHGEVYNVWSLLEAGCSRSVSRMASCLTIDFDSYLV